ncbi:MAG: tetratricopeptide repeat protein [Deltaproteobacteria bacterium]|nr:tetratricopeptide repeat protein [Deltaproteobacteria bacterium]MBW2019194.1 tetratricopeptide repeat protein [Deltaproteobacteria bacterium]MBW2073997.1 tetratricopeptide repeat protein [Deltaproteobacteria bacterium]
MSHIHEALKKAQKEKDALYHKYHGVVSAAGSKPRSFSGKALRWTFLPLILLAFATYLWLPSKNTRPRTHEAPGPEPTPQAESVVNAAVLYERARLFHKRGRLQEAKRLYEEVLSLKPDYVDALNNLGVIHIQTKNYLVAQNDFEKAIRLKPSYVDPHYNLACLHALKGEVTQCLAYLKEAVSLDPSVKEWARMDTDLHGVYGMPEFEEIIGNTGVLE